MAGVIRGYHGGEPRGSGLVETRKAFQSELRPHGLKELFRSSSKEGLWRKCSRWAGLRRAKVKRCAKDASPRANRVFAAEFRGGVVK